jgi:Ca-activated chloride channel family protein
MEIGNPRALYFMAVAAGGALLFIYELAWSRRAILRFAGRTTMDKVLEGFSRRRRVIRRALIVAALALLVLAWAMPRVGRGMRVIKREGADVVIALDVSVSMLAEDVSPNRMEVAKRAVNGLVARLEEDRFALVGFAGAGFVHCPLTTDSGALAMFVDFLDPGVVTEQGTSIAAAITQSLKALESSSGRGKAIVIVTDGEDHPRDFERVLREAEARNVRIFTLGVGTPEGEPIPIRDGSGNVTSYKRDESDNVVVSRLNTDVLDEIARATGGESYVLGLGDRAISRIARAIEGMEKGLLEERTFESYVELFQIPLALCFAVLLVEALVGERRSGGKLAGRRTTRRKPAETKLAQSKPFGREQA